MSEYLFIYSDGRELGRGAESRASLRYSCFGDISDSNLLLHSNLIRLDIECGQNAYTLYFSWAIDATAATIPTERLLINRCAAGVPLDPPPPVNSHPPSKRVDQRSAIYDCLPPRSQNYNGLERSPTCSEESIRESRCAGDLAPVITHPGQHPDAVSSLCKQLCDKTLHRPRGAPWDPPSWRYEMPTDAAGVGQGLGVSAPRIAEPVECGGEA